MISNPAKPDPAPTLSTARKFLVTGATGFIGHHLVAALTARHGVGTVTALVHPQRGARDEQALQDLKAQGVAILECDLLDLPRRELPRPAFDTVYHLAAFTETETAGNVCRVNSDGTRHLLEWLGPALRGRRFIYTSTLAVMDPPPAHQLVTEAVPPTPRTEYGRSKLLGEQIIRTRQADLGFEFTILRLCTVIGPDYRPGGMFARCPAMLAAGKLGARLNWPGRIAFLAVSDAVRLLVAVPGVPGTANETYVASNGENPTFDELLGMMAQVLALPRRRVVLPGWFWRLVVAVTWPLAGADWLPHTLRVFCWRISHIVRHGQSADAAKLNKVFGNQYKSVLDALRETYPSR